MKEFKKWMYTATGAGVESVPEYEASVKAWKAALEWVLSNSETSPMYVDADTIIKELED